MTFARFMELALYHPEAGYYTRPDMKVGRGGDFFTTPTLHAGFGRLVARQLLQLWELLERPATFNLLELGAGNGEWAAQILAELGESGGGCRPLSYVILERSPALRARQRELLARFGQAVRWVDSWAELAPAGTWRGVILSNELFDALPVHKVMQTAEGLRELGVKLEGDRLGWCGLLPTDPRLEATLQAEHVALDPAQQAEIGLAAQDLMSALAQWLGGGFVLTVDYGGLAAEVYDRRRMKGTLRGFYRQLPVSNPFLHPGEQDLTADVDFTALIRAGEAKGLHFVGLTSQGEFLRALGIDELAQQAARKAKGPLEREEILAGFRRLHHPTGLGEGFRVMLQAKGPRVEAAQVAGWGGPPLKPGRARRPWERRAWG